MPEIEGGATAFIAGAITVSNLPTGGTATPTPVATSGTNATLVSANSARLELVIYNNSTTGTLYVKFGATASSSSFTHALPPQGTLIESVWVGRVDAVLSTGTDVALVTEITK